MDPSNNEGGPSNHRSQAEASADAENDPTLMDWPADDVFARGPGEEPPAVNRPIRNIFRNSRVELFPDGDDDDEEDYEDEDEEEEEEDGDEDENDDEDEEDDDDYGQDEDDDDDDGGLGDAVQFLRMIRDGRRNETLTTAQLLALFRDQDLGQVLFQDDPATDAAFVTEWARQRQSMGRDPNRFPKVPSEKGTKLMHSGSFGMSDSGRRPKNLSIRMLEREMQIGTEHERNMNQALITQSLLPNTKPDHIIHYDDPVYSGQFSDDGHFFFACSQDFKVRMYDTRKPYHWKHYKTVNYPSGRWTLTDATLSPDNQWLAYTSIASVVSIAPTDPLDTGEPYGLELDANIAGTARPRFHRLGAGFGIWSVRFSGDGKQLVAGTNDSSIIVYDIESRRVLNSIHGHDDDVNAVCFADTTSPHILYSGSDDATIKVWDTRDLARDREVGAFIGHTEGLTYIDSKGDGRYMLSNGKDQNMKLWDLRRCMSSSEFRSTRPQRYARTSYFDYRGGVYDENEWEPHPCDNSVVTFRGHKVLRTLIRCHFSPPHSSNSRYVYTGSADGKVYIYNMDATLARIIDVRAATIGTRTTGGHERHTYISRRWGTCVRDASWNPNAPIIVASAWNGPNMTTGTCTQHSWDDSIGDDEDPALGQSVNDILEPADGLLPSTYQGL